MVETGPACYHECLGKSWSAVCTDTTDMSPASWARFPVRRLRTVSGTLQVLVHRLDVDRKTVRRYLRFERNDASAALSRTKPS